MDDVQEKKKKFKKETPDYKCLKIFPLNHESHNQLYHK